MNDVKLSGRLTRDTELKHTPNGVPVATFALAVDRKFNREEADFIPVTTCGRLRSSSRSISARASA